jgi:phage-related protein
MVDRSKKLLARFYETPSGRKPVRDWLLELDAEDRRIVGYDIQTVEFGWPIGMPVCRSLDGGLWEVRSELTSGRIGRVIFCLVNDEMVLLHGFIKKSQKTPSPDLDIATKRRKEIAP